MPQNSREKRKDAPRPQRTGALSEAYKSASKAVSNIPSSAKGVATGIIEAVAHPADSLGALSDAGLGLVSSGIRWATGRNLKPKRGETEAQAAPRRNRHEQSFGALKTGLVNRYGSASAIKNTFETDPVGMALDVLPAAAGVAMKGTKLAPKAARVIKAVAKDAEGSVPRSAPKPGALNSAKLKITHRTKVPNLDHVDPKMVGTNRGEYGGTFTNREEISKAKTATGGRSYFGVNTRQPGGYVDEKGAGAFEYEAEVDPNRYLFTDGDSPDLPVEYDRFLEQADAIREDRAALAALGLPPAASRSVVTERLIKDAGFDGIRYGPAWNKKYGSNMGEVLHHWGDPVPVKRVTPTVPEDFLPENVANAMTRDDWAMLTGENPRGQALGDYQNRRLNEQLGEQITALGAQARPARGHYGDNPENSFLVSPVSQEQALRLGGMVDQDSVLTNRGLLYHDGTITPSTGIEAFDQAPENYFTSLRTPSGDANFSVGLQWADDGDMVRLPDATRQPGDYRPAAPAIIQPPKRLEPDWGYDPYYSKLRNGPKRSDLDIDFEDAGTLRPRVSVSPEDLYGSTLIAGQADRTRAGGVLRGLNGKKFETPVDMEGGQDFMRDVANEGSAWASMPGVMNGVLKQARKQEGPVVYTPFTMQGTSGDYSTMSSDAIAQAMGQATKKSRGEFDEVIRQGFPEFPGFAADIDQAQEFMRKQPALRTTVAKVLDTKRWRDSGLPSVEALRHAITAPELADVRTEAFGYNMARIDPSRGVNKNPANPHGTYAGHLPGDYMGSLDVQVPANLMFPDVFDQVMNKPGAKRSDVAYNLKRGVRMQKADQQWLDGIMPWYEHAKSTGDFDW